MSQTIIDLLNKAERANNADEFRQGNLIYLPCRGSLVISGDIHGHRRNFEKIVAFADLENNPDRHVILQEIIHGGVEDAQGGCLSYKLLFDVARYKLNFADHVHIIMGNHATAFITDGEVLKNGKEMNRAMCSAIERQFKDDSYKVISAMKQFLLSMPLAVRCDTRIWASHSLPSAYLADKFDREIFDRPLEVEDLKKPGSAYLLTWGRNHSQQLLDKMAELLDVDLFVLGHQAQPQGWSQAGKNLIIIASDHSHGCLMNVDLTESYTVEQLIDSMVPLASITGETET